MATFVVSQLQIEHANALRFIQYQSTSYLPCDLLVSIKQAAQGKKCLRLYQPLSLHAARG